MDMGALPSNCIFCAGDGFLFAVETSTADDDDDDDDDDERAGSVLRFCPAARSWELITSTNPITNTDSSWTYHSGHLYGTSDTLVESLNLPTGQWDSSRGLRGTGPGPAGSTLDAAERPELWAA